MRYQQPFEFLADAEAAAKESSMFKTKYVKKLSSLGAYVVDESPLTDADLKPICSYYEGIRTTYPSLTDFHWIRPGYIFNHSFRLPLDKWRGVRRG